VAVTVRMKIIGIIRTAHYTPEHTPVLAALNPDQQGAVELDPSSSQARSRTWSSAPGSTSWTGASTNSEACRGPGRSIGQLHDRYH
jgi:hypothetical protein